VGVGMEEMETINYLELLQEWQTLVAGLMALFAAFCTIFVLKWQHAEERKRNAFYMRSKISDALCDLILYSEQCFKYIYDETDLPSKSNEAIEILKENIKYSDSRTSKNLSKIVSFYQVHNSRIDSYEENKASNKKKNMLYDIAMLYHYSNSLFSYARNEAKSVKKIFPSDTEMTYAVKSMIGRERYYNHSTEYDKIFTQVEDQRKTAEKYSKPRIVRKAHYLTSQLQTYYKQKFNFVKSSN
jgi:hypothetical protein